MADILQMTFCNAFSWMKIIAFWFDFHRCCSQGSNDQLVIIHSGDGLELHRQQAITWNTLDRVICCHMVSSDCNGLNEYFSNSHNSHFSVFEISDFHTYSRQCCMPYSVKLNLVVTGADCTCFTGIEVIWDCLLSHLKQRENYWNNIIKYFTYIIQEIIKNNLVYSIPTCFAVRNPGTSRCITLYVSWMYNNGVVKTEHCHQRLEHSWLLRSQPLVIPGS